MKLLLLILVSLLSYSVYATSVVETCIEEGGALPLHPDYQNISCCPGLASVPASREHEGTCQMLNGPRGICVKCGNGQCGNGENPCNCPSDCGLAACGAEGTVINGSLGPNSGLVTRCCAGLSGLNLGAKPAGEGVCQMAEGAGILCTNKCGNGKCEGQENKCNCPSDCISGIIPGCGQEGTIGPEQMLCCPPFKKIANIPFTGEGCANTFQVGEKNILICANCGDGICGKGENKCNCPADCGGTIIKPCAPEGETLNFSLPPQFRKYDKCCEGLNQLGQDHVVGSDGKCQIAVGSGVLCTKIKCGDGNCEGKENKCNCPADCISDPCGPEGFVFKPAPGPIPGQVTQCCKGLISINLGLTPSGVGGICAATEAGVLCTGKCGDGKCEGQENKCNCQADCQGTDQKDCNDYICKDNGNGRYDLAKCEKKNVSPQSCAPDRFTTMFDAYSASFKNNQAFADGYCASGAKQLFYLFSKNSDVKQIIKSALVHDCGGGGVVCAKVGENFSKVFKDKYPATCCSDLKEWNSGMDSSVVKKGKCVQTGAKKGSPIGTCLACGDGKCDGQENVCNCPEDCDGTVNSCIGEGEQGTSRPIQKCCKGLKKIRIKDINEKGRCSRPEKNAFVCTKCGDKVCTPPENWCNCRRDCKTKPETPISKPQGAKSM